MQSLHFVLWKIWKNNWNIVLKVNMKKLTLKMAEIINNKCDPSHISNFKRINSLYCWSAPDTHQESNKACFKQSPGKKEQSNGFLGLTWTRAGNTSNLISILEICHSFHPIHHWQTTKYFRRRNINSNCDHKSSFFDYFILLIISNDFWIYRSPALKSRSWLGATITL